MRAFIVNRYFAPDESATSRIASSLAAQLSQRGIEMHVLTSRQRYGDASANLPADDAVGRVRVHRLWTTRFGRRHLPGRALDYASFHLSLAWHMLRRLRGGDVCIVGTDPPLASVTAVLPAALRRAIIVNWLFDLFPEVALDLGVVAGRGLLARLVLGLRDWSLRHSSCNVAPIEAMADHLRRRGIPDDRLAVIEHWAEGGAIHPLPREGSRLRAEWGLEGKIVVGYSGNLGRAHEFDTFIDAASQLRRRDDIVFLFIGDGHRRPSVEAEVARRGLSNVQFKPLQPREQLCASLGLIDIHLVSLLPAMEPYIIPSKFYGITAAGRPTLFVGALHGEIARRLAENECGASVAIGDADGLERWIVALADAPELREAMGERARRLFESSFSEGRGASEWTTLLTALAHPAGRHQAIGGERSTT